MSTVLVSGKAVLKLSVSERLCEIGRFPKLYCDNHEIYLDQLSERQQVRLQIELSTNEPQPEKHTQHYKTIHPFP